MATLLNNGLVAGSLLGGGAVLVWALGLYVASRSPGRRVSVLSAAAMLCLAIYLMGEALGALAPDLDTWATWLRRTWWAPSLALPIWLALTLALLSEDDAEPAAARTRRYFVPIVVTAVLLGAGFGAVGVFSTFVED